MCRACSPPESWPCRCRAAGCCTAHTQSGRRLLSDRDNHWQQGVPCRTRARARLTGRLRTPWISTAVRTGDTGAMRRYSSIRYSTQFPYEYYQDTSGQLNIANCVHRPGSELWLCPVSCLGAGWGGLEVLHLGFWLVWPPFTPGTDNVPKMDKFLHTTESFGDRRRYPRAAARVPAAATSGNQYGTCCLGGPARAQWAMIRQYLQRRRTG